MNLLDHKRMNVTRWDSTLWSQVLFADNTDPLFVVPVSSSNVAGAACNFHLSTVDSSCQAELRLQECGGFSCEISVSIGSPSLPWPFIYSGEVGTIAATLKESPLFEPETSHCHCHRPGDSEKRPASPIDARGVRSTSESRCRPTPVGDPASACLTVRTHRGGLSAGQL
jgi:hypothetical protein